MKRNHTADSMMYTVLSPLMLLEVIALNTLNTR